MDCRVVEEYEVVEVVVLHFDQCNADVEIGTDVFIIFVGMYR